MPTYGISIRTVIWAFFVGVFLGIILLLLFQSGLIQFVWPNKGVEPINQNNPSERVLNEQLMNDIQYLKRNTYGYETPYEYKLNNRPKNTQNPEPPKRKVTTTIDENFTMYLVSHNDTLDDICQHYEVTPQQVIKLNNLSNPKKLEPGTQLLIPLPPPQVTYDNSSNTAGMY